MAIQVYQEDIARVAEKVITARQSGARSYTIGETVFRLDVGGYCARFVRQCHEAAMGLHPFRWEFCAPDAIEMEENLRLARHQVENAQRGDIIAFNRNSGPHGHIGIYLGNGKVAENTISGRRGNPRKPGTKISRIDEIGRWRITGFYRPLPNGDEIRLINLDSPGYTQVIECNLSIEQGTARADVRPLLEALGYEVIPHIIDQRKIYVRKI